MDGLDGGWDVVTNHGTVVRCESHINIYMCKYIGLYIYIAFLSVGIFIHMYVYIHIIHFVIGKKAQILG